MQDNPQYRIKSLHRSRNTKNMRDAGYSGICLCYAAADHEAYFTLQPYGRVELVGTGFPLNRASRADLT
jgi:hypothetical protein